MTGGTHLSFFNLQLNAVAGNVLAVIQLAMARLEEEGAGPSLRGPLLLLSHRHGQGLESCSTTCCYCDSTATCCCCVSAITERLAPVLTAGSSLHHAESSRNRTNSGGIDRNRPSGGAVWCACQVGAWEVEDDPDVWVPLVSDRREGRGLLT